MWALCGVLEITMLPFRSLSLILFLSIGPTARAEVLYEREITEDERERYQLRETQNFFGNNVSAERLGQIRKEYSSRKWRPEVVRVELLYTSREHNRPPYINDPGYGVQENWPYIRIVFLGEVIYERELTELERKRFKLGGTTNGFEKHVTVEQIRKQYKNLKWDLRTAKVELLFEGNEKAPPYIRPYVKIASLGKDLILQAKVEKWLKEARQRLAIGRDYAGFRFVRQTSGGFGRIIHTYHRPKGEGVSVTIREGVDRPISLHQFLKQIVNEKCKIVKTDIGYVVVSQDKYRGRDYHWTVSWRSGDKHVVSMYGPESLTLSLAPLYGEKFPSTLPRKFKIDKRAWGRAEMERIIAEMKACLDREDRPKDPYYIIGPPWTPFRTLMGNLRGHHVYFPLAQEMFETLNHQTPLEEKLRMFERLTKWWQENKKRTYWHKKEQCLVAKRQSQHEIAKKRQREAKKRAKQELADRINAPLSEQEIKAAKEKLAVDFARDLDIAFQRKELKDSPRINELFFRREGDRWIRSRPAPIGAGRIIRTFEIISFKRQEKKRRALRVEVRDRKLRTRQNVYDEWVVIYEYDKIRGVWDKTKTTHLGQMQVEGQSK